MKKRGLQWNYISRYSIRKFISSTMPMVARIWLEEETADHKERRRSGRAGVTYIKRSSLADGIQ